MDSRGRMASFCVVLWMIVSIVLEMMMVINTVVSHPML